MSAPWRIAGLKLLTGCALLCLLLTGCDVFTSPARRVELAREALSNGDWGRAALELRKAVQAEPENAAAWVLLAQVSLDAGDARDASEAIDRAMKAGARGSALDALRARTWLATGQPSVLIDAVAHHAVRLAEPDRTVALGRAYVELGQPSRAITVLQPLLSAYPHRVDVRLTMADALEKEGRIDQALKQVDAAAAADPAAATPLMRRGEIRERQGELAVAEQAFTAALRHMAPATSVKDRATALVGLTETRLPQGEIAQAALSQAALAKLLPDAPATQILAARIRIARHDYAGGIGDLERIVARSPNILQARLLLASAQVAHGELEQGRTQLEQVIQQVPNNIEARLMLADVRLRLEQPEEALNALAPVVQGSAPLDSKAHALLGAIGARIGGTASFLAVVHRSAAAHPQDSALQLDLAAAYLAAGQADKALSLLTAMPGASDLPRERLVIEALNATHGPREAGKEVERLVNAHRHDRGALELAASYLAAHGALDRARELLSDVVATNPRDAAGLIQLAQVDLAAGDAAEAERILRQALAASPKSEQIRVALAEVLIQEKSYAEAERLLQGAEAEKAAPAVGFALAHLDLARGDTQAANGMLDRVIASQPRRADLIRRAGTLLLENGQYAGALDRFRKAAELVPDDPGCWLDTARAQLALHDAAGAGTSLAKALQLRPQWLPAVTLLTTIDLRDKNEAIALQRVRDLIAAHPGDPGALALAGDVDWAIGRRDEALADYVDAQRRRPDRIVAEKLFRARLALHRRAPEASLVEWLSFEPGDDRVRLLLAGYHLANRSLRAAASEFEAIVAHSPKDFVALNNLAWTYLQLHDARAEKTAERAYRIAPRQPQVLDTLGWILARKHATQKALPLLEAAAQADAADADMQYHLAYVLVQAGRSDEARRILKNVLASQTQFITRRDAERLLAGLRA